MAKKSVIAREHKRQRMVRLYIKKRALLKKQAIDPQLSTTERWKAQLKLQSLPRDSSRVRMRLRCLLTGRPRGVYRKFSLGRNKLREMAMRGEIPGLTKASW